MSYEEEDTCMSYEEEDTCMSYEEEDTCLQSAAQLSKSRSSAPTPLCLGKFSLVSLGLVA
jgi:hypothetical protein